MSECQPSSAVLTTVFLSQIQHWRNLFKVVASRIDIVAETAREIKRKPQGRKIPLVIGRKLLGIKVRQP